MVMWARTPHSHVSKSFSMTRLDFGQGVGKGDLIEAKVSRLFDEMMDIALVEVDFIDPTTNVR